MSLLDIVQSIPKIAHSVVKSLEPYIVYERCTNDNVDGAGAKAYAAPVSLQVVLEYKQRQVRTSTGELTMSTASILFIDMPSYLAVAPAGISTNDRVTLPDGTRGAILAFDGFANAGNGLTIYTQVYLG